MSDYIPKNDTEFVAFVGNLTTYAAAHAVALGITPAQVTAVTGPEGDFEDALTAHVAALAASRSATTAKRTARANAESELRKLVRIIQNNPNVTDAQREALGINVRKAPAPAPAPTSKPLPEVVNLAGLTHVLHFTDSDTGDHAKPDGVRGTELYMKIVAPGQPAPAGDTDMVLVDVATTTKTTREFSPADIGKTAYYLPRWVNTRGEKGPWGPMVAATIAA